MKKTISILVIAFLAGTVAFGQVALKGAFGLNFGGVSEVPADYSSVSANAGYQFGGSLAIGDKFYVEPGIRFVRNARTFVDATSGSDVAFAQNFVKIPVYAGYHILGHESGPVALRIFAGPSASIAGQIKKGEDQISKDDINNAFFMVDAGLGLDILFLFVEANYEYALTQYWVDEALDANHWGFLISAGIHIDF